MQTKFLYCILIVSGILFFSACGNKSGDGSFKAKADPTVPDYIKTCEEYTIISKGDIIKKETKNTIIKVIHGSDGVKKVCAFSGKAYISK